MRVTNGWLLVVLLSGIVAPAARGQQWAQGMFEHFSCDFGTVARGAKAEHYFTFQNKFEEDLSVSVTSSCGCTIPSVTQNVVRKWQKAAVVAKLDTVSFSGVRHATLRVSIRGLKGGLPFDGEVLLNVNGTIRQDVVVQPGVVDLGSVPQGSAVERRATIAYAGNPNWQITKVENGNPNLNVRLVESGRDVQRVNYDLTVTVKADAAPGYIKDQLVLVTNDVNLNSSRVPVPVEGVVMPGLTVHPAPLVIKAAAGEKAQAKLLVKSQSPFRVTGVSCPDARFQFELPAAASALQWIQVTFVAGSTPERLTETLHIISDAAGSSQLEAAVQVTVTAAATPAAPAVAPKILEPKTLEAKSREVTPKAIDAKSILPKDLTPKTQAAKPAESLINESKSTAPVAPPESDTPTWRARPRMVPFPQEMPAKPTKTADAPASPLPEKSPLKKSAVEF